MQPFAMTSGTPTRMTKSNQLSNPIEKFPKTNWSHITLIRYSLGVNSAQ